MCWQSQESVSPCKAGRVRILGSTYGGNLANFPTPINSKAAILQKRGITNEQADILKIGPCTVEEAIEHLGYRPKGSISFLEALPYWDVDGYPLGEPQFYRFRINYTPGWEPPGGDWKEFPKYRSPFRKGEFAYLPRGVGIDWVAVAGSAEVPVIITEGEYKSIKVCSEWKLPCIGLGGVWMFHASKPGWPGGMDLNWAGREVFIVYDADTESTLERPLKGGVKGVEGASKRLANKLYQEHAVPTLLYIARTETFIKARARDQNVKMGLDDYIEAGGSWGELLATRENPIEHAGLAYLMDRYAYYRGSVTGIVEVKTGVFYKVNDWYNVEANCIGTSLVEKGGKLVPVKLRFPTMYMEHPERPEFSQWVFDPSSAFGLDQEKGTYNRWRGMEVEGWVGEGESEQYKDVISMWRAFVERLCGGREQADYFEKWCADLFQNPGRKTTIAMLLRSSLMGVGKSLLGEVLRDIVGKTHSSRIGLKDLVHHFNSLLGDKVLLQIDEVNDFRKEHESKLNELVTDETCVVTLKGRDSLTVANFARLFLTANGVAPMALNEHNRRWYVMEPDLTVEDEQGEWAQWVGNVVAKTLRSPDGLRFLRFYFDTIDIRDWVPTARVPKTEAMMDIVEASSTKSNELVDMLWKEFLSDPNGIWVVGGRIAVTPEAKVLWSRFKDKIKLTRGQSLSHVMRMPGESKTKRVRIFVRGDAAKLPEKHVPDQGPSLDTGNLSTDELKNLLIPAISAAEKAYAEWSGVMPSEKY